MTLNDDAAKGRLIVEAGRSVFSLATLPKEDFYYGHLRICGNFSAPVPCFGGYLTNQICHLNRRNAVLFERGFYMLQMRIMNPVIRCVATDGHLTCLLMRTFLKGPQTFV